MLIAFYRIAFSGNAFSKTQIMSGQNFTAILPQGIAFAYYLFHIYSLYYLHRHPYIRTPFRYGHSEAIAAFVLASFSASRDCCCQAINSAGSFVSAG